MMVQVGTTDKPFQYGRHDMYAGIVVDSFLVNDIYSHELIMTVYSGPWEPVWNLVSPHIVSCRPYRKGFQIYRTDITRIIKVYKPRFRHVL